MKVGEIWDRTHYHPNLLPKVKIVRLYKYNDKDMVEVRPEGNITSDGLWIGEMARTDFIHDYRKVY